jgi:hypothetical protein
MGMAAVEVTRYTGEGVLDCGDTVDEDYFRQSE